MPETIVENSRVETILWGTVVALFVGWEMWLGLDQRKRDIQFKETMLAHYLAYLERSVNGTQAQEPGTPVIFAAAAAAEDYIDESLVDDEPSIDEP